MQALCKRRLRVAYIGILLRLGCIILVFSVGVFHFKKASVQSTMQMRNIVFVISTSILFHKSQCHSNGAPASQCESMTPSHGAVAQAGASPYEVKVNWPYYMPGENVRVSIESSSDNIKGYLIQARQVGGNSATGLFSAAPVNGKHLNCSNIKVNKWIIFHVETKR
jgi:hypothetical protein